MTQVEHELGEKPDVMPLQRQYLPPWWAAIDRGVERATKAIVFVIGVLFCLFIFAEAASRYLLSFSIFFVNAGSKFLLVWFFFLGAGLALREGLHMGVGIIADRLPPRLQRVTTLVGGLLSGVFIIMIFYSSMLMLGPGSMMIEDSIGISLFWGFLSMPVSFALLAYHLVTMVYAAMRQPFVSKVA